MTTTYFHGGILGLRIGGMILPPSVTANSRTERRNKVATGNSRWMADEIAKFYRRDRVFVTTDKEYALYWALAHKSGQGQLYRVEPIGELVRDSDEKFGGTSFECESARVLEIIKIDFRLRQRRA